MSAGQYSERSPWPGIVLAAAGVVVLLLAEDLGADVLNDLLLHLPGVDKVLHVAQSFAISLLFFWLLGRAGQPLPVRVLGAAAAALGAAIFDEIQQQWRGDRHVELADIAAGCSGITLAAAWRARAFWPRATGAAAIAACLAAGAVTYDSYHQTRDYNRGILAARRGDARAALGHYLAAVTAGVRNPEAYNAAAWALAESADGDPARAVELARRSLAMRPDNADTLDTYGWALYRAGRPADALTPLSQALAAKPDIYCIHYHLGMTYLATGAADEGQRQLRLQIERMPGTREAVLASEQLERMAPTVRTAR